MKQYIHNVPGRLRIKTPNVKRNIKAAKHVERFISQLRGVKSVYSNTTTGSVLITYDSKTINHNTILDICRTRGIINDSQTISLDEHINETASKAGYALRKTILGTVAENVIKNSALSFLAPIFILI